MYYWKTKTYKKEKGSKYMESAHPKNKNADTFNVKDLIVRMNDIANEQAAVEREFRDRVNAMRNNRTTIEKMMDTRKDTQGDIIILDIGTDAYTASISYDPSLLIKGKTRASVDLATNDVWAFGYGAKYNERIFDRYSIIDPFEYPHITNEKLLAEICRRMIKQLPLQNRNDPPAIILVGLDKYTRKEIDSMKYAFEAAGAKCYDSVIIDKDELKYLLGGINAREKTTPNMRRVYLDEIVVDEERKYELPMKLATVMEYIQSNIVLPVYIDNRNNMHLAGGVKKYQAAKLAGLNEVDVIIED